MLINNRHSVNVATTQLTIDTTNVTGQLASQLVKDKLHFTVLILK